MTKDKRDECGCHRACITVAHECDRPCVWPTCLTPEEQQREADELETEYGVVWVLETLVPGGGWTPWAQGTFETVLDEFFFQKNAGRFGAFRITSPAQELRPEPSDDRSRPEDARSRP